MAVARPKAMGWAWLLLFLTISPVLDVVAVGDNTTDPETWSVAPLQVNETWTYSDDTHQDGGNPVVEDDYYKDLKDRRQGQYYAHLAVGLCIWMPLLTFMIMGDPIVRTETRCTLRDTTDIKRHDSRLGRTFGTQWTFETRLGVFRPFNKIREKGIKDREIMFDDREGDSSNVIVSGFHGNETITVVPYTAVTKKLHTGFVATMVHRAKNVAGNKYRPLSPNSLLIALNCVALTDNDMSKIGESDLQSFIEKKENEDEENRLSFGRVKLTFLDLDETEHEYCPIPAQAWDDFDGGRLEIVPAGSCKYHWPNGQPAHRGVRTWMSTWKLDSNEEIRAASSDNSTAARIDLGVSPTGTMGWGQLLKFTVVSVLAGVCSYLFAWMPLSDPDSLKLSPDTSNFADMVYVILFAHPSSTKNLANILMGVKLFVGGTMPVLVLILLAIWEYNSRKLARAVAFANNKYDFGVVIVFVVFLLWAPAVTYYNSINTIAAQGMAIRDIQTILSWIGLQLALLFWVNTCTAYINERFDMVIPQLLSAKSGEIVLGLIGVLSAFVSLLSTARSNEDMGTGSCEVDWLGHTLRTLARDRPETFPSNYTLDLKCSNLDMTFSDVLNNTIGPTVVRGFKREYDGGALREDWDKRRRVVPGEVCTLTCTPPPSDSTTPATSSPIVCDNKGAKGARWSLEFNMDKLAPTLCPHPVKLNAAPVKLNVTQVKTNMIQEKSVGETKLGLTSAGEAWPQTAMAEVVDATARQELEDTRRELAGAQRELQEQRTREGLLATEVASLRQMVISSRGGSN